VWDKHRTILITILLINKIGSLESFENEIY